MSFTLAEIRNGTGWDRNARFELVDSRREENYAKLQELGKTTAESLAEMVAALECDYTRLEELRAERDEHNERHKEGNEQCDWASQAIPDYVEELAELESAAGDCESREDAERRIQEDPLSVEVRSGWREVWGTGDTIAPEEFCILLGTGGPATRIRGELDEHCEPTRAWIETQDWFLPWTEYHGDAISQEDLLTYCRCFYFGE